jgi:hypothetical protein
MSCNPPGEGLNIGIPGISRFIAVTTVAGFFEDQVHISGYVILSSNVTGLIATQIFFGVEELDDDQDGEEGEEDFATHALIYLCKSYKTAHFID